MRQPARLVVIIREVCNAIINAAVKFVSGKQIFDLIAEEQASSAVTKLKTTLRVCGDFKRVYFNYKVRSATACRRVLQHKCIRAAGYSKRRVPAKPVAHPK